jgi:hypothetical protein
MMSENAKRKQSDQVPGHFPTTIKGVSLVRISLQCPLEVASPEFNEESFQKT